MSTFKQRYVGYLHYAEGIDIDQRGEVTLKCAQKKYQLDIRLQTFFSFQKQIPKRHFFLTRYTVMSPFMSNV